MLFSGCSATKSVHEKKTPFKAFCTGSSRNQAQVNEPNTKNQADVHRQAAKSVRLSNRRGHFVFTRHERPEGIDFFFAKCSVHTAACRNRPGRRNRFAPERKSCFDQQSRISVPKEVFMQKAWKELPTKPRKWPKSFIHSASTGTWHPLPTSVKIKTVSSMIARSGKTQKQPLLTLQKPSVPFKNKTWPHAWSTSPVMALPLIPILDLPKKTKWIWNPLRQASKTEHFPFHVKHVVIKSVDPQLPASLSPKIRALLRKNSASKAWLSRTTWRWAPSGNLRKINVSARKSSPSKRAMTWSWAKTSIPEHCDWAGNKRQTNFSKADQKLLSSLLCLFGTLIGCPL